jgi:uroporphyrin-III C-methyltransferase/precorrin-2 dehydrogenase/sirohydrochlorin ferrochelatase
VRLKGGDPFVFGRGGEEAIALAQAGIPFEVVPGVTSAVAAPGLAGIPVTHRGVSSGFVVVGGHDLDGFVATIGALPPKGVTIVVLMGLGARAQLAAALIDRRWPGSTPAAVVTAASTEAQSVWRGTLDGLARGDCDVAEPEQPGTIVVGEVVSIAGLIARPEPMPAARGLTRHERAAQRSR